MTRSPILAAFLSLLVPGLGQLYSGRNRRGVFALVAAIVIGNLNLIFLLFFFQAGLNSQIGWKYWIPRIGHDVISFWSIVFWIWVIVDAHRCAKAEVPKEPRSDVSG